MVKTFSLVWICVFFLVGCNPKSYTAYEGANTGLDSTYNGAELEGMIAPYRLAVDSIMNKRIGFAPESLIKYAPESSLSNFAVDVVFSEGKSLAQKNPDYKTLNLKNTIGLINFGGLRAPINQGDITIGNVYELMPFDNTVVIAKLDKEGVSTMLRYLKQEGGQPIANCKIDYRKDSANFFINRELYVGHELFVITSNYLASGGDGMTFLQEAKTKWDSGVLIREVFIDHISSVDTLLAPNLNGRIQF